MDSYLEIREIEIQNEMSKSLVKLRLANGIKNPFIVTKEIGLSTATLRNIEKGIAFPTKKTLSDLLEIYTTTPLEKQKLLKLKDEMLKIRRQKKELNTERGKR